VNKGALPSVWEFGKLKKRSGKGAMKDAISGPLRLRRSHKKIEKIRPISKSSLEKTTKEESLRGKGKSGADPSREALL